VSSAPDSTSSPRASDPGIVLLRVVLSGLLVLHGVARIRHDGVVPFGGFLEAQGFPLGVALAWGITAFELVGGAALALGRFVTPIAALFAVQLAAGIVLVHAQHGWFVVGAGTNGVEYSVCLIAGLVAIIVSERSHMKSPGV
jgi:putative oxidoreductase